MPDPNPPRIRVSRLPRALPAMPRSAALKKQLQFTFPKRAPRGTRSQLQRELTKKIKTTKPALRNKAMRLKCRAVSRSTLKSIAGVRSAPDPLAQVVRNKQRPEDFVGDVYGALVLQNFREARDQLAVARKKLEAEARKRARTGRKTLAALRREYNADLKRDWPTAVTEHAEALRLAGLRVSGEGDLNRMANALSTDRANYDAFLSIRATAAGADRAVAAPTRYATAEIIPTLAEGLIGRTQFLDIDIRDDWCGLDPIEGSVTKHWSKGFELKVRITYPCGVRWCRKWGIRYPCGVKWCSKDIVLASGSASFSLDVGYRINCCGGIAWGSAEAEACGTVAGATLCASCEAHVTGTVGAGKAGSGGQCTYGLGATIGGSCKLGGYTVFSGNFSFGWVIEGPCPPLGLCA